LFFPEPETQGAPEGRQWHRNETDSGQLKAKRAKATVRPGADLIACAIDKGVDKTFGFIFVSPPQDGEKYFARRSGETEISRPARDLENCQETERWRKTQSQESNHA